MLKDLKKIQCCLISYCSDKEETITVYDLFGLVEKMLKMISAFLLLPLYFYFTILIELTCQKCPWGSPPFATLGDNMLMCCSWVAFPEVWNYNAFTLQSDGLHHPAGHWHTIVAFQASSDCFLMGGITPSAWGKAMPSTAFWEYDEGPFIPVKAWSLITQHSLGLWLL